MAILTTDLNITGKDISGLTSADAVAGFLTSLGYNTDPRVPLTAESIGLAGDSAAAIKSIELLSEDGEKFLRVVFVQLRSLTAKSRNDLARVLGKTNVDHLLILTSDFSTLEFVLLHKRRRETRGPGGVTRVQVVPLAFAVDRKAPATKELRTIRRFTWTCRDGLEQFDKLRTVFEAAAFSEEYFCNRALFADHWLISRLRDDAAWRDNPSEPFHKVRDLLKDAQGRWLEKGEQIVRDELYLPLFEMLGFQATENKTFKEDHLKPDYLLTDASGKANTAAFVYAWDRWLDGPDFVRDQDTSDENPGACVVSALEDGVADWIIVTNGRVWRLYSRQAHSRATNFYEVDLAEALIASGDTDPNEAFRYWWLFFRAEAFAPRGDDQPGCWLDAVAEGSRDYAKRLGERLKVRIFETIFPHLARGFLEDRKQRLGIRRRPSDEELSDAYEATLTLLYRLLFLLYAEARDLLPIREGPYREASLKKIKEQIAEQAGVAESEVTARLTKAYSAKDTELYDRLTRLCVAMDKGAPALNVPIYNGGLFVTDPDDSEKREQRIARFLAEHKVPDRQLALAIDRLARDPDEKTLSLVSIDYKSLEVRHLGSIYEGLLEFKLKVAEEDLTTKTEKKKEKYIPLTKAKPKRGKAAAVVVRQGQVYLSNDKAERKASGSYYTPDPIVNYIVEHTVGPVLEEKLEALRGEFRKVRKTFDREVEKATAFPVKKPSGDVWNPREFAEEKTYTAHRELVERLFDFRTLDPAMGSGHFLVEAVDFITDRMLAFLNRFPVNPVTFMLERTRHNILDALEQQGLGSESFREKLTNVNLLKRHVLKRCIYGVDLNPMAVELAKVSLWLDAFTIGAPLSFLDHHLRCGNSLIGATFEDLKDAVSDYDKESGLRVYSMFGIDYEPLKRAIQHVVFVNSMADATAAEVKQSASEYTQARNELSGYKTILDLIVVKHFGFPKATGLLAHGHDLDLSSREKFLDSLDDDRERELVSKVEALAQQPDRRFFHWEIEFPEVYFGFDDSDQRRIEHKNSLAESSAGFDTVIGNPPYVSSLELKKILSSYEKPFWKQIFASAKGTYDLYVLFLELALKLISRSGQGSLITPNKYLAAPYGAGLRQLVYDTSALARLWDVSRVPVFDDPSVYPVVTILSRRQLGDADPVVVDQSIETLDNTRQYLHRRDSLCQLPELIWGFLLSEQADLLWDIVGRSVPLDSVCRVNASTTAGEADSFTEIIDEMPSKGIPEGWRIVNTGLIDRYRFLWGSRPMAHAGLKVERPYLFDDSISVSENRRQQYDSPKIIFAKIAQRLEAAFDSTGHMAAVNVNFAFAQDDEAYFYLGLLNSQLMNWIYVQYFGALRMSGGYLQFQAPQIRVLPIIRYQDVSKEPTVQKVVKIARNANNGTSPIEECSEEIDGLIYELYELTPADVNVVQRATKE